jgi:hypothetical protein
MAPSLRARRSRLAWWAGLAVVALLWSQVYARYVVRVGLFPLLETLCFASLWRGWRANRLHWWGLGGALAGLCFYSYLPARLLPVVLAAVALLALWRDRPRATQRLRGLILAGALALLIVAPLAVYYVRNPLSFSTRVEQVSVLGRGVTAISENARAVLGMVLVAGDANPRYNLPGRPALDWLTAIPFLVGLAYSLWNWRRPAAFFTLCWLAVMVMPTVFSEYAPSFQRAIGALPAFGLLIALGLDRLAAWAEARIPRSRVWPAAVGWTVLGASIILTWRVFAVWSADPALFYARDAGFARLGQLLIDDQSDAPTYISPRGRDHPTVRYSLLQSPAAIPSIGEAAHLRGFDGRICVRVPGAGAARYLFLAAEDFRGPGLLQSYLPDGTLRPVVHDAEGRPWALELLQPAGGRVQFPEMIPNPATLDDGIDFLGYWLSETRLPAGGRLYVRLFWRARERPQSDYTTFVHLSYREASHVQAQPSAVLQRVAGADAPAGRGSCPTTDWRPAEVIVDELELALPAGLPAVDHFLAIGLYAPGAGPRLRIPGHADDQIIIGPFPVRPAS